MWSVGFEFKIRTSGRWPPSRPFPSCEEFLEQFRAKGPLAIRIVEASAGGYRRVTYEFRRASSSETSMPDAHLQIEDDGFYFCENAASLPGLMEDLVRYALQSGPVTIEEL
jgi:hypothetical protein